MDLSVTCNYTDACLYLVSVHQMATPRLRLRTSNCSLVLTVDAVVQLIEYRTRNQEVVDSTHTRSTASNLEQVANLLCAQANSASYPQWDGK